MHEHPEDQPDVVPNVRMVEDKRVVTEVEE